MQDLLTGYEVNAPTWFYLSLLLIIAVFFRFGRIWSLRNLDILLLLSLAPGLLLSEPERLGISVDEWPDRYHFLRTLGMSWLFGISGLVLVRLLCDSLFQRRPLIEPNLVAQGLVFLGVSAFAFVMSKVIVDPPSSSARAAVTQGEGVLRGQDIPPAEGGPTAAAAGAAAAAVAKWMAPDAVELAARIIPVIGHLAVVIGLYLVGRHHFRDRRQGVAMATLYLLIPCTTYDVGEVNHVLPAALCVWAFVCVQRPLLAGALMGLACGSLVLLPVFLFLLPLWCVYYERKRGVLFALAVVGVGGALLVGVVALTSPDVPLFSLRLSAAMDGVVREFQGNEITEGGAVVGFWNSGNLAYRIPVIVVFLVLLGVLTIWPRRKTFEHLISHSAALVVATQFWYSHQGGIYVLWYLPLLLLVVFRPRLASVSARGTGGPGPGWYEPIGSHVPVGAGLGEDVKGLSRHDR
ncbi:MAG: hypothetical protein VB859_00860 [Planctomycetaceae bacterium]